MRIALHLGLCLSSGLLLAAAYPRAGLWPLAWVALVPWLVVVFTARWAVALIGSLAAGFAFFAGVMYWIAIFGYLPWALMALIQGLAFPATAAVVRVGAARSPWRVALAGAAWVAWEFLRGQGQFGVPWGQVGHSQAPAWPVAQLAAWGGVQAISFVVVVVNAAIAHAVVERASRRGLAPLAGAAALVAAAVGAGVVHGMGVSRAADESAPPLRVALAQASVKTHLTTASLNVPLTPDQQREELAAYADLTREAAALGADVVVWPESAVPGYLQYERVLRDAVTGLARDLNLFMVVGGPSWDDDREYNSIHVISPQGEVVGRYDKVHLVPFGEYVPGRRYLPLLRHYRVREVDVTPGERHHLLEVGGMALGPMICFESVFAYIAQRQSRLGAQALLIVTNDAWFLRTAAAAQHLQIGRFRAIEQGLPVIRAAATGISAFIDPAGRVTQSLGLMRRSVLVQQVRPRTASTLYAKTGPLFALACVAVSAGAVVAAAASAISRNRRRRTA